MPVDHEKLVSSPVVQDTTPTPSGTDVEQPTTQSRDNACPDGGFKAWLTVMGAALIFFSFGPLSGFGVFETYYAQHQLRRVSLSTISWIGGLQAWLFAFAAFLWGRIFDVYGPRVLLITGSILLVLSTMAISVCTELYQFLLAQGLLRPLAYGMLYYPSMASIATHFIKRRATALGIAGATLGLGGITFPIAGPELLARIGFGWTMRTWGFLELVLCAIGCAAVTSRLTVGRVTSSSLPGLLTILRDVPFVLLVAGTFLVQLGVSIPYTYLPSYAVSKGVPSSTAFYIVSALNGGSIVGYIIGALVADVVGYFNVITPAVFLMGLLTLVFWMFAETLVQIVCFAAVYGCFQGTYLTLTVSCVAQISDVRELGTRIGIMSCIHSFANLAGPPAGGAMLRTAGGRYMGMITLCGGMLVTGSLLMLLSKYKVNRDPRARV